MAKILNLVILNSADKTRQYSVATGKGAISEANDHIVTNTRDFPVGSQYTDTVGRGFYVRCAAEGVVADWQAFGGQES